MEEPLDTPVTTPEPPSPCVAESITVENSFASKFKPFPKGQSGNPKGRPKGSFNKTTMAALAMLDGQAEAITQKVVELALAGDMGALKLCFERLVPIRKDRAITMRLPAIQKASDVVGGVAAVLESVAQGNLTPTEGQAVSAGWT